MPLPRLQTTRWRRPHFTSRRRWRVARQRASVGRVQLMPLPRPQTTWRPLVSSRTKWRVARLILHAGVGRVQLMPLSHAQMCVEWSVCAAAEPADDAATALCEQKRAASCEADAARRRRSRAADATATLRCVWSGLCAARCVLCVDHAAARVLCVGSRDVRGTQPSVSVWFIYVCIYLYSFSIYIYIKLTRSLQELPLQKQRPWARAARVREIFIYLLIYLFIYLYMYLLIYTLSLSIYISNLLVVSKNFRSESKGCGREQRCEQLVVGALVAVGAEEEVLWQHLRINPVASI